MGKLADFFRAQGITPGGEQQKRQMLALDREFVEMEAEITRLQAENQNLRAQVNPLEQKVKRLEQRIQENSAKPKAQHVRLGQAQEEVLTLLAAIEVGYTNVRVRATGRQIAAFIKKDIIATQVILRKLDEDGFIYNPGYNESESRYALNDLGQEYVAAHDLLKKIDDLE